MYRPIPKIAGRLNARAVEVRRLLDAKRAAAAAGAPGTVPKDLATNRKYMRTKVRKQAAMFALGSMKRGKPQTDFLKGKRV